MTHPLRILIADDDAEILHATARVVKSLEHEVIQASSFRETWQLIQTSPPPDMVLLDVNLGDGDGTELCRRIKEDASLRQIFVVLISGSRAASDDQAAGLEGGADGYIGRPVPNRELRARIQAMSRIVAAERERDRLIAELQEAQKNIRILKGFLPICLHCKKIRDDAGFWNRLEAYISEHTDAMLSHSICPECAKKHYPDMDLFVDDPEHPSS